MSASTFTGVASEADEALSEAGCWQELEWGHYAADLPLWEELAPPKARVLELGCGSGRVALHLAARDREVVAVDRELDLLADLGKRAAQAGIAVRCLPGDAAALRLGECFDTVLAPLQLVNVVAPGDRAGLLRSARLHLAAGGTFALSILSEAEAREVVRAYEGLGEPNKLAEPDVMAIDGSIYSSSPLDVRLIAEAPLEAGLDGETPAGLGSGAGLDGETPAGLSAGATLVVSRHRAVARPAGRQRQDVHEDRFHLFAPDVLVREAAAEGLVLRERRGVPETSTDAATTVFVFEAASGLDSGGVGAHDE